jgi:flagellar basal body-associated protein FliL
VTVAAANIPASAPAAEAAGRPSGCGSRHLRLIGLIVGIVLAVCAATLAACWSAQAGLETRLRRVEQNDAANAARFEAIKEALQRIEGARGKGP